MNRGLSGGGAYSRLGLNALSSSPFPPVISAGAIEVVTFLSEKNYCFCELMKIV